LLWHIGSARRSARATGPSGGAGHVVGRRGTAQGAGWRPGKGRGSSRRAGLGARPASRSRLRPVAPRAGQHRAHQLVGFALPASLL
jgi:hypothetical protein